MSIFLTTVSVISLLPDFASAEAPSEIVVPVKIIVQSGSLWTESLALEHVASANQFFHQNCGVSLAVVEKRTVDFPGLLHHKSWRNDARFRALISGGPGVTVIFTGQEDEMNRTGYSWYRSKPDRPLGMANSIFIFELTLTWAPIHFPGFDILAHEFGHIFLEEPHNFIHGNFMGNDYDGMAITIDQCDKIRANLTTNF